MINTLMRGRILNSRNAECNFLQRFKMRSCIYYFSKLRTILDFITGQDETIKKSNVLSQFHTKLDNAELRRRGEQGAFKIKCMFMFLCHNFYEVICIRLPQRNFFQKQKVCEVSGKFVNFMLPLLTVSKVLPSLPQVDECEVDFKITLREKRISWDYFMGSLRQ